MKNLLKILIINLLFFSCTRSTPNSSNPGNTSLSTSLLYNNPENNGFYIERFKGYLDDNVILFKDWKYSPPPRSNKIYILNGVKIDSDLFIERIETANIHWQEFLFYSKRDSSEAFFHAMLPDTNALPSKDYFINEFYRYYPVVGVNKQQVEAYLAWKTEVVAKALDKEKLGYKVIYRLPTEAEWEKAAAGGLDIEQYPYGVESLSVRTKLNPKASNYLKILMNLNVSEKQLRNDIATYNKSTSELLPFNVKQKEVPYFLQFKTPFYVFNSIVNKYGVINMIGNVAEMTDKEGVAKGGSYMHDLVKSGIKEKIKYKDSSPFIGFRAIAEVKYSL